MSRTDVRFCAIVPAYQEQGRIGRTIAGLQPFCPDVIVVDDGSRDSTAAEAEAAGATVVRHGTNRGKGVALETGFAYAREHGFEVLVTLDGDGQHDPADIPAFIEAYRRTGLPVLIGNRMSNPACMPLVRKLTNRFMSWMLSRQMGQCVPDTQCGYRLYRCDALPREPIRSERFAAESEILLALAERGVRMGAVPIKVIYRDEKSKIRPVRDTLRFIQMLRRHARERNQRARKPKV